MADSEPNPGVPDRIGRYRLLQNPQFSGNEPIKPLGRGGTAAVYLAEQELVGDKVIRRALKLFDPTEEVKGKRAARGETYGRRHFVDEIAVVSGIVHQNIVGIIDAGQHGDDPFFVMDYVEGPTLEKLLDGSDEGRVWAARTEADPYQVIRLAQQMCWPLAYLHRNRRFHFDIAPKNIFMRTTHDKPHILIGDLGVSRYVPPLGDVTDKKKMIFVAGTREYTPPILQEHRSSNSAPIGILAEFAAHWDMYALGKVILEMIEKWGLNEKSQLDALKWLCERLITDTEMTADKASDALERLLPVHVVTVGIEELSAETSGDVRYISMPLAPVPTTERVRDVLDHPVINRLQLVPQLLLYRSVTPGGVHTAFESLLGSYGMAIKCVTKLLADPRFRESFSPKEHEEALVAILLSRVDKLPLDRIIRLVKPDQPGDRRNRLTELLSEAQDGGPSLREVIASKFLHADIDAVVATLTADTSLQPYQECTRSLIESSISARAIDYLQRDALHTGISAGSGIDAANLIESLRWSKTDNRIGISRSGVFSAEHLLSARYWMFIRLYWNTNNRAIAAMLRHVMSEILSHDDISASYLTNQFSGLDEAGVLRAIDSHWANTAGHGRERSTIMELLKRPRPRPYKQLFDRFSRNWGKDKEEGRQKMSAFADLDAAKLEFMRRDFLEKNGMTDEDPSIVLFDYPSDGALKLGEDVLVDVGDREQPLDEVSDIISLLPKTFNDTCVRLRVFHDPNLPEKKVTKLREAASDYLDEWVKNAGK